MQQKMCTQRATSDKLYQRQSGFLVCSGCSESAEKGAEGICAIRAQQNQAVELFCTEQAEKAIEPFLPETAEPEKQEALPLENIWWKGRSLLFAQGDVQENLYMTPFKMS